MGEEALLELKVKLESNKSSVDSIKPVQELGWFSKSKSQTGAWGWVGSLLIVPVGWVGLVLAIRTWSRSNLMKSSISPKSGDEEGVEFTMLTGGRDEEEQIPGRDGG